MTDKEIKDVAQKYAEETNPAEYYGMDFAYRDESVENAAELAEEFIRWLLCDHCVVSREKFEEVFQRLVNAYDNGDNDMMECYIEKLFNTVWK